MQDREQRENSEPPAETEEPIAGAGPSGLWEVEQGDVARDTDLESYEAPEKPQPNWHVND